MEYGKLLNIHQANDILDAVTGGFDIWVCKDHLPCEKVENDRFGLKTYRFRRYMKGEREYEVDGTLVGLKVLMDNKPKTVPGFYIPYTQFDELKTFLKSGTKFYKNEIDKMEISKIPFSERIVVTTKNNGTVLTENPLLFGLKGGRRTRHSKTVRKHKRRTHRQCSRR
jgi:hypothetical protein